MVDCDIVDGDVDNYDCNGVDNEDSGHCQNIVVDNDDLDVDGDDVADGVADGDDPAVDADGDAGDLADDVCGAHDDAQDLIGCIMNHGALGCTHMLAAQRVRL